MERQKIDVLINSAQPIERVVVKGWVRTRRDAKSFSFIEINDGSCLSNIQVIADADLPDYDQVRKLTTGSAVGVTGELVASKGGTGVIPPSEETPFGRISALHCPSASAHQ